jgi:hypothetical protein
MASSVVGNSFDQYDMATALELPVDLENEAKFVALKNLHGKKLRLLMSSLDNKEKEIEKLKAMSKDNRRSQMIQDLKTQIKELELINDVVKEELTRRTETSLEEINQQIIRKTLGGPKRFRPPTHEEMELKIMELEKKLAKKPNVRESLTGVPITGVRTSQVAESKLDYLNASSSPTAKRTAPGNGVNDDFKANNPLYRNNQHNMTANTDLTGNPLLDTSIILEENHRLKSLLHGKETLINNQRDEIIRLRARNTELVTAEEEMTFYEKQYQELTTENELLIQQLDTITQQLAVAEESIQKLQQDELIIHQQDTLEKQELQEQCEQLLYQNNSLIKQLKENEELLTSYEEKNHLTLQKTSSTERDLFAKDKELKSLVDKLAKVELKYKQAESKIVELQKQLAEKKDATEKLRNANIRIKELERALVNAGVPVPGGKIEAAGATNTHSSTATASSTAAEKSNKTNNMNNNSAFDHKNSFRGQESDGEEDELMVIPSKGNAAPTAEAKLDRERPAIASK